MRCFLLLTLISSCLLAETALQLTNPGFEGTGGWPKQAQGVSYLKEAAHSGEVGIRVKDESATFGSSFASSKMPVTPGKSYAIRFWGISPSGLPVTGIYSRFYDANGKLLRYSDDAKEHNIHVMSKTWTLHTLVAIAPKDAAFMDIWIHSFVSMTGETDLDDFSVAELTPEEARTTLSSGSGKGLSRKYVSASTERIAEIAEMLTDKPMGIGPTGAERERWMPFVETSGAQTFIKRAEKQLGEEPVVLEDEGYLEFSRNGNRTHYQAVLGRRSTRLSNFVFAELVEWKGRFLPAIEADLSRLFTEKSWTLPAHDGNLTSFNQVRCHGDLAATELAGNLAQIDWWLQDKLSPAIRRELRQECLRRVIDPYREDVRKGVTRAGQWWITGANNWNGVCTSNLVRACMILLEDKLERAEVLASMEISNRFFLNSFTPDGYCSEGVGYWGYGFGHFAIMAEIVLAVTNGRLNIYDNVPHIEAICAYARDIQIDEGICPAFADCSVKARPARDVLALIQRHFPQTLLKRVEPIHSLAGYVMTPLRLFTDDTEFAAKAPEKATFPPRKLFENAGIYIGRCEADAKGRFGVAFKAGHNGELHNHNDVGSFVVVDEQTPYILDPGSEIYTRRTFSAQRYVSQMLNSYGHSVPVVAGKLQSNGRISCGTFISHEFTDDKDVLVCDMKEAYRDVKELKSLLRTLTFDRANRRVIVRDEVEYTSPQSFATALVTYKSIQKLGTDGYAIYNGRGGLKATIATEGGDLVTEVGEIINENSTNPKRIGIALATPVQKGAITVTVERLSNEVELFGFYEAPDEKEFFPQFKKVIHIEAENIAKEVGGEVVVQAKPGASGNAFKFWDRRGHTLSWKVTIPSDGRYAIRVKIANGAVDEEAQRKVSLDGELVHPEKEPLIFPRTSGWANSDANDWKNVWLAQHRKAVIVTLKKGDHILTMENVDDRGLNLDWIQFVPVK